MKSTVSREKISIKLRFRYNVDVGIIRQGIQVTLIIMFRAPVEKADNRQEHMANVSRDRI